MACTDGQGTSSYLLAVENVILRNKPYYLMQVVRENRWSILSKKMLSLRGVGPLVLLLETALLYAIFVLPPLTHFSSKIRQMKDSIPADLPLIKFDSVGTHIEGTLPFIWRLPDSTVIFYTRKPDSLYLKDKPIYSLVCSDSLFLFKTGSRIYPVKDLNLSGHSKWTLGAKSLTKIVDFFLHIGNTILHTLGLLAFLLVSSLIVLFGAGVASMVDGFSNGPFHFRELIRLAALVFLFATFCILLFHFQGVAFFSLWKWAIPIYLVGMFLVTYFLIRKLSGE
jgi:hypothetical protein